ncbi:MAG: hypothetical protein SV760_05450, partial [Halobacteria archaeon]|nr:hypothetical protein [Halobacteria archaeon]
VAKLSYNFSGFVSEYGKTETEILFGNPKFPSKMIRESQVEETTSGNSVQVIVRGKSSDSMLAGCKISGEKSIGLEMMVGE